MTDFFWLTKQAWSAVIYFWPTTLTVLLVLVAALCISARSLLRHGLWPMLLMVSPLLVPFIILAWGSIMHHDDFHTAAPSWPMYVLVAFLLISVCFFGFVIWRAVGLRWLALAIVLCSAWFSLCAVFIASMSLQNDWL